MKTIKIIDLLVKIANKEEVPKKIKHYNGQIYTLRHNKLTDMDFYASDQSELLKVVDSYSLNYEVEIIEEKPKEIKLENNHIVNIKENEKHYVTTNVKDRDIYIPRINCK